MRSALLLLAASAGVISMLPTPAAADTLSKEKYLNDEGGSGAYLQNPQGQWLDARLGKLW
jgi:hypothetical protein